MKTPTLAEMKAGVKKLEELNKLEEKIRKHVRKAQKDGDPITIASLAKKVKESQKKTYDVCEDMDLCINVAVKFGTGVYDFKTIGECSVEDVDAPPYT